MEEAFEDLEVVIDIPNQPRDRIGNGYEIPENLQFLSLINNRIREIDNLDKCTQLVHLCLRQNFITSSSLQGLIPVSQSLIKLDLYENQIDGVGLSTFTTSKNESGEFVTFPKLRYLDISFNPIRQLNFIPKSEEEMECTDSRREGGTLAAFPHLEYLYFVECKMRKIPFLNCCSKLKVLELGGNRIREIEGVECLPELKELWFGKNKIVEIKNLNLPRLGILSLQANRIIKIQGLENLSALTQLYLSENGIEVMEGLSALVNLKILDLDRNRISVIQGIETLVNLEEIWLSGNQISSFQEVEKLKGFAKLDTVCLEHNPIYKDPQYRNKILAELQQITQLDAIMAVRGNNPLLQ